MPRVSASVGVVTALLAVIFLAGCRESGGEGEYFKVGGKLVVFNYRVATARFLVNLVPLQPMREGEAAVVSFEDPAGGEPLVVREIIWPKMDKTTVESPPLRCIVKDRPYAISIRIEAADGTLRQEISTTLSSSQDQTLLPDKPLVVGPFYTPNPELAGHPGGDLHGKNDEDCPAKK